MPTNFDKPHLTRIEQFSSPRSYQYPKTVRIDFPIVQRNRSRHGNREDLTNRTAIRNEQGIIVCLLDSGVNNKHPLISDSLPDNRLYTLKEDWGLNDSEDGFPADYK